MRVAGATSATARGRCSRRAARRSTRSTSPATPTSNRAIANGFRWSRSTALVHSSTTSTQVRFGANCRHKVSADVTEAPLWLRLVQLSALLQGDDIGSHVADRLTVGVAARLSRYLQVLTQSKKMGKDRISSQELSDYTNINATQIRRDLAPFGKFGKRGVGYNIDSLLGEIRKILRTQGQHNIALVGVGRLGQAIASSPIFAEHGIHIAAVFDRDPDVVGIRAGGVEVQPYGELKGAVREKDIVVGVIAVPADSSQDVADELVAAGVKIIFNYSEALLDVPHDVQVHTSNPAVELLHALYFHLT